MLIFVFNHTATTEIYTLSLHDALPICLAGADASAGAHAASANTVAQNLRRTRSRAESREALATAKAIANDQQNLASLDKDRKSTRLNSSHVKISYAVFCLKKKKKKEKQ